MRVASINCVPSGISFQAKPDLKKLWDAGKLPQVKNGFYGDVLDLHNITREHLLPKSQGGTKRLSNIVLASAEKNMLRSNHNINDFVTKETAIDYLKQFQDISLKDFNGIEYIKGIVRTLKKLGLDLLSK